MKLQLPGPFVLLCLLLLLPALPAAGGGTLRVASWFRSVRRQTTARQMQALNRLLAQAEADSADYRSAIGQCDSLFWAPASPFHDDSLSAVSLRHRQGSRWLAPEERMAAAIRLRVLDANRPGHRAADFGLLLSDGRRTMFSETAGQGGTLLIVFDPSCRRCQEFVAALQRDARFGRLLEQRLLHIVCADADADPCLWEAMKSDLPPAWTAGMATDDRLATCYDLRAFPSVYLLDRQLRVAAHDDNLDNLFAKALKMLQKDHRLHQKH